MSLKRVLHLPISLNITKPVKKVIKSLYKQIIVCISVFSKLFFSLSYFILIKINSIALRKKLYLVVEDDHFPENYGILAPYGTIRKVSATIIPISNLF